MPFSCIDSFNHPYPNSLLLHLILLLLNFPQARKESIVAEVKWFYRVSELPEAVYCLLMDDRKKGTSVFVNI